ncbi:MAG: hypothetical protein M1817_006589 [Caeruleum heppii]|nr:MAG: hypothetical protein M1817_006589 [Caeruleum heppii]
MTAASHVSPSGLLVLLWLGFSLATILTILRLYIRRTRLHRLFWDDSFHILAWALLLISAVLNTLLSPVLYSVIKITNGEAPLTLEFLDVQTPTFVRWQFVLIFLFWSTLWAVKISFLIFYRRFFDGLKWQLIAWWAVTIFTVLAYVGTFTPFLVVCGSPSAYFEIGACLSQRSIERTRMSIKVGVAFDVVTDLMIIALPLRLLWNLRITRRQKYGLAAVFSLALIIIIVAIVRAVETSSTLVPTGNLSLERADPMALTIYSVLESTIAVIVSCLPTLRVLVLRPRGSASPNDVEGGPASHEMVQGSSGVNSRSMASTGSTAATTPGSGDGKLWIKWLPRVSYDSGTTLQASVVRSRDSAEATLSSPTLRERPSFSSAVVKDRSLSSPVMKEKVILSSRDLAHKRSGSGSEVLGLDKPLPPLPRSPSPIHEHDEPFR